ncbi:hypothetical protein [Winogradskyella aurantia]|uniref:DUF4177 domain-containing protein n=1 Tax=Winogradskyella aurantia TaxID=1915063 RepID=A0A265UPC2_9FLAO|nr:hypothetical protein [Winogradskyella aurantia]OZV67171.1 hypothetical protein CA834_12690 [Winogradskyella aurantia]
MKKSTLLIAVIITGFISYSFIKSDQPSTGVEYRVVTSVESIVPNGLGRSRLISSNVGRDYDDYTSERSSDKNEDSRNKSKRSDIRVKDFEETKLLNFYNIGGIRFQNIVANDAVITSKLIAMADKGWELAFVSSSSESDAGKDDGQGIFVTRYIFKRPKQQ